MCYFYCKKLVTSLRERMKECQQTNLIKEVISVSLAIDRTKSKLFDDRHKKNICQNWHSFVRMRPTKKHFQSSVGWILKLPDC